MNETKSRILVIEDNQDTAENLALFIRHAGYECELAYTANIGLEAFINSQPDLVLLDRMLPGFDGVEVCKKIRETSRVPIIMLTARVSSHELIEGLDAGADEYVKKPFNHTELMARLRAHLRRTSGMDNENSVKCVGRYSLDETAQQIHFADQLLKLTKTEYLLLRKLLMHPRQVLSREQLFVAVFGYDGDSGERTVDVHLHNIKKKLVAGGGTKHGIEALYGIGYKLNI